MHLKKSVLWQISYNIGTFIFNMNIMYIFCHHRRFRLWGWLESQGSALVLLEHCGSHNNNDWTFAQRQKARTLHCRPLRIWMRSRSRSAARLRQDVHTGQVSKNYQINATTFYTIESLKMIFILISLFFLSLNLFFSSLSHALSTRSQPGRGRL